MKCIHCDQEHPEDTQFCPKTGKKIIEPLLCPKCGSPVNPDEIQCIQCGEPLIQKEEVSLQPEIISETDLPQTSNEVPVSTAKTGSSNMRWLVLIIIAIAGLCLIAISIMGFWGVNFYKEQGATMTAESWTATPTATFTPTNTPTPTSTPTSTPTITPTSTMTPPPLKEGYQGYTISDFYISLPKQWESVDVDKDGINAILKALKGLKSDWAKNYADAFSAENIKNVLKFWAMDSEPLETGFASINIVSETSPLKISSKALCIQVPTYFKKMGVSLINSKCDFKINDLDVAQFTLRYNSGTYAVKQYQYYFVRGKKVWTMTLSVDEKYWTKYQQTFETIAESLRVNQ
jgi:hypothetical protein